MLLTSDASPDPVSVEQARQEMRTFYESLDPQAEDVDYLLGKRQDPGRDEKLRRFFADVQRSESANRRIEALALIDDLYVHVVPDRLVPELVEPMLNDAHERVRFRAARALAYRWQVDAFPGAVLTLWEAADTELRVELLDVVGHGRSPAFLPPIEASLADDDPRVREAAIHALNNRIFVLRQFRDILLDDPDPRVRAATASSSEYRQKLLQMLDDPSNRVREHVIRRLAEIAAPRDSGGTWRSTVNRLTVLLDDADVGSDALEALATMGDARVIPTAIEWLASDHGSHRMAALEAIQILEAREALPALDAATGHADEDFAREVAITIRRLGSSAIPEAAAP